MKNVSHNALSRVICLLVVSLPLAVQAHSQRAQSAPAPGRSGVPSFKVVGRDSTALSLVVPRSTTEAELVALVNEFRVARERGTLAKFIPPTTPKGSRGPYAVVMVFVFSDPGWATSQRLHAFVNPKTSGISASEKAFGRNILAYYYYTSLGPHEVGSIGYSGEGYKYTTNYRKLF